MEKLKILLVMLVSASGGLAVSGFTLSLVLSPSESPLEVLSQILTNGFPATFPFLVLFSSLLFLSTVLASMVGVIYFLVLPEIKSHYGPSNGNRKENTAMVLKTLKPEERNIVNVLDAHGGTYLQKYITKESGLSKLKTHRVVATLSERGIVLVEKYGNTNQVTLVKWFQDGMRER
ncbi:hypothetical protein J2P12_01080 [Candidatus Bathyarchaeota archaeon]|nr:hypothetical protein [Candidatus Bathyarchaeota archaeon]